MDRELAEKISKDLLFCSGKLDKSVALIQGLVEDDLFNQYRRKIGEVMGLFYIELLRDIYTEFPDLEPESIK